MNSLLVLAGFIVAGLPYAGALGTAARRSGLSPQALAVMGFTSEDANACLDHLEDATDAIHAMAQAQTALDEACRSLRLAEQARVDAPWDESAADECINARARHRTSIQTLHDSKYTVRAIALGERPDSDCLLAEELSRSVRSGRLLPILGLTPDQLFDGSHSRRSTSLESPRLQQPSTPAPPPIEPLVLRNWLERMDAVSAAQSLTSNGPVVQRVFDER